MLSTPAAILIPAVLLSATAGAAFCYWWLRRSAPDLGTIARQREELRAMTRRLMTVQEDERGALSRELHDDIGQAITAIKLCAMSLVDERGDGAEARRAATVDEIAQIADETVLKLRNLSLLLRPPQLDALGLEAALRWQAGALFRSATTRLTMALTPLPQRPDPAVELACFRIAQEALTNVLRHSGAREVTLTLVANDSVLELHVQDDGCGFDPDCAGGLGLVTMRERAQQLDGSLQIDTHSPGGTRVCARLPMQRPD